MQHRKRRFGIIFAVAIQRKVIIVVEKSRSYGRSICEGIISFAARQGNWTLSSVRPEKLSVRDLKSADGAIVRIETETMARKLRKTGIPVIDLYCERIRPGVHRVDCDHVETGRLAAEYFLSHHFCNYAFCGFDGYPFSDTKRESYVQRLREAGFTCHSYRPKDGRSQWSNLCFEEDADKAIDRPTLAAWLESLPRPSAVFCCSDARACHVTTLCRELGLRVPQDISVLGVDDDRLLCSLSTPPISSISRYATLVGETAARTLNDLMEGRHDVPHLQIIPSGKVVERASTLFYPVDPPWLSRALAFIDQNVHEPIDANAVFDHIGVSHTAAERIFRKELGTTVARRIAETKLREADRLIATSDMRTYEIADALGYSSAAAFCRVYRRIRGHSPLQPRRALNPVDAQSPCKRKAI